MPSRSVQPTKVAGTTKNFYWDFISDLAVGETISTKIVTMSVYSGADANPAGMVSGGASSSGTVVTQLLTGGVLGVVYEALCKITTSLGQTLQQVSFIVIVASSP